MQLTLVKAAGVGLVLILAGAVPALAGSFPALAGPGTIGDGQTTLVYDAVSGALSVDPPSGRGLTSLNIDSAGQRFIGGKPAILTESFDNFAPGNIFHATFGSEFGVVSFGNVLAPGLSQADLLSDLTAVGSLAGGGDLGPVDLVVIPEPSTFVLMGLGLIGLVHTLRRRRQR